MFFIFIYGEKLFGRVYQVPGVCHVSTKCFHIFFFPVFPFRSYIIDECGVGEAKGLFHFGSIQESRASLRGVRIPLRLLSIVFAILRTVIGVFIFLFGIGATIPVLVGNDPNFALGTKPQLACTALTVGSLLLFWFSRWVTRATPAKAARLQQQLASLPSCNIRLASVWSH
jgi:hypothetical protein